MRLFTTTIAIAALLLTSAAGAAESDKDLGKGATPPAAPPDSPSGGKDVGADITETHDLRALDTKTATKAWEIGAGFEYHRMIYSSDVADGSSINVNYFSLYARYDLTANDRLTIRGGAYEKFLVDSGDSAGRLDDLSLSYTRRIALPGEATLRLSAGLTAPISYASQLNGIITVPRLSIQADKKFGYLTLEARIGAGWLFASSAVGGSAYNGGGESGFGIGDNGGGATPNPKASLSGTIAADLTMPFYDKLGVGVSAYTGYAWFYDVNNGTCAPSSMPSTVCMYGAENTYYTQPAAQSYGWEITAHYAMPTFVGVKSDFSFSYAPVGDGSLGYQSVLNGNGVPHIYFQNREHAEVYFSLNARY